MYPGTELELNGDGFAAEPGAVPQGPHPGPHPGPRPEITPIPNPYPAPVPKPEPAPIPNPNPSPVPKPEPAPVPDPQPPKGLKSQYEVNFAPAGADPWDQDQVDHEESEDPAGTRTGRKSKSKLKGRGAKDIGLRTGLNRKEDFHPR